MGKVRDVRGDDVELAVDFRDVGSRVLRVCFAFAEQFAALEKYVADLLVDDVRADKKRRRLRTLAKEFWNAGELQPTAKIGCLSYLLALTNKSQVSVELPMRLLPNPM